MFHGCSGACFFVLRLKPHHLEALQDVRPTRCSWKPSASSRTFQQLYSNRVPVKAGMTTAPKLTLFRALASRRGACKLQLPDPKPVSSSHLSSIFICKLWWQENLGWSNCSFATIEVVKIWFHHHQSIEEARTNEAARLRPIFLNPETTFFSPSQFLSWKQN